MQETINRLEASLTYSLGELTRYKKYYRASILFGLKDPQGFQKLCQKLVAREGAPKTGAPQLLDGLGVPLSSGLDLRGEAGDPKTPS
jgi:hypothetical protein